MQVRYGKALHEPGCKAVAEGIITTVNPKNIDTPPPRFTKINQPYSLKSMHGRVERRLVPTKCEMLRQEDEDDADDNGDA